MSALARESAHAVPAGRLLEGRAIVITGAARGMGRAYARDAARQGAAVVLNDLDADELDQVCGAIRAEGAEVRALAGSVTDPEHRAALLRLCLDEFGSLDGLVNNAGVFHVTAAWEDDPAAIARTVAINFLGAAQLASLTLDHMCSQRRGSIVNVASVVEMGMWGCSAYGATKGAISAATRSWAVAAREANVRVNAVSPRGSTRMIIANGKSFDENNPAVPPELTGPVVSYLLSDLAADLTGQVIRLQVDTLAMISPPTPTDGVALAEATDDAMNAAFDEVLRKGLLPYSWRDPLA